MKRLILGVGALVSMMLGVLCFTYSGGHAQAESLIGITGTVSDQTTGAALEGVMVHASPLLAGLSNVTAITDVDGYYNMDILPGLYAVDFTPSTASGYVSKTRANISLLGVQVINEQLTRPSYNLTGTIKDSQGHALSGLTAHLSDYLGTPYDLSTNESGVFSGTLPAGQYTLTITGVNTQYFPDGVDVSVQTPLDLSSNTSHVYQLPPTTQFTVSAADNSNAILAHRDVRANFAYQGSGITSGSDVYFPANVGQTLTTNSSGNATMLVFADMTIPQGNICIRMSLINYDVCNVAQMTVSNIVNSLSLKEPPLHALTGRVTNATGSGIADTTIYVSNYDYGESVNTDAQGYYSISVPAGSYTVSFYLNQGPLAVMLTPINSAVNLNNNMTRNFSLPATTVVNLTAKDNDGSLLVDHDLYLSLATPSNGTLQSSTDTYTVTASGTVATNSSGVASFVLFNGLNSQGGDISTYIPSIDAVISNSSAVTLDGNITIQFNL